MLAADPRFILTEPGAGVLDGARHSAEENGCFGLHTRIFDRITASGPGLQVHFGGAKRTASTAARSPKCRLPVLPSRATAYDLSLDPGALVRATRPADHPQAWNHQAFLPTTPPVSVATNCSAISSGPYSPRALYQCPTQFSAPLMAKAVSLGSQGATDPSAIPSVMYRR